MPAVRGTDGVTWTRTEAGTTFPVRGRCGSPRWPMPSLTPGASVAGFWSGGGYLWASGYNWGWTPFRCGRWNYVASFGWGWAPGQTCGGYGYAGFDGGVNVGRPPLHWQRPVRPVGGPGHVHPIIIVRGKDGPRPPTLSGGPIVLGKSRLAPLPTIGSGAGRSGGVIGGALNRDFAVDRKTGQPVLGRVPESDSSFEHPGDGLAIGAGQHPGASDRTQGAAGCGSKWNGYSGPGWAPQPTG